MSGLTNRELAEAIVYGDLSGEAFVDALERLLDLIPDLSRVDLVSKHGADVVLACEDAEAAERLFEALDKLAAEQSIIPR